MYFQDVCDDLAGMQVSFQRKSFKRLFFRLHRLLRLDTLVQHCCGSIQIFMLLEHNALNFHSFACLHALERWIRTAEFQGMVAYCILK